MQAPQLPASLDFPRIKVLAVGSSGTGKSCLIKRYCEGRFVSKYIPTIGIDYGVKKVEVKPARLSEHRQKLLASGHLPKNQSSGKLPGGGGGTVTAVRVNFWDVGGGDDALEVRNEFYAPAQGILLVYDVRDRDSFLSLDRWWEELASYTALSAGGHSNKNNNNNNDGRRISQNMTTSNTPAGRAVGNLVDGTEPLLYLIANKVDDVAVAAAAPVKRVVSAEEGRQWAERHNCVAYFETSAAAGTGDSVVDAMEHLFYDVLAKFCT